MTSDVISIHDGIDVIKLLKTLVIKAAQIIVQARDGNKVTTKCVPICTDFLSFNLNIREIVEVEREVKRLMNPVLSDRWSVCIEVYLKTSEGDHMVLETWNVYLVTDFRDNVPPITVYNRLGVLLKSLLAITRVVPAYRYSRKQNPDSYKISYKIYIGEPQCNLLGDKCKHYKVGSVGTPLGTVHLAVHYRTIMTISHQPSEIESPMLLKSDHFQPDFSPKHARNANSDDNSASLSEGSSYKVGAFVESRRESLVPLESDQLIPTVPFGSLLLNKASSPPNSAPTRPVNETELCDRLKAIDTTAKEDSNANVVTATPVAKSTSSNTDDFIVVDLVKPPFAESTGNIELGTFYQEWKSAPPLQTCPVDPRVIDQVGDLTSQLACYETSLKEFDSVVTSLCEDVERDEEAESTAHSTSPHFVF